MKIMIKQLFCRHDYKKVTDRYYPKNRHFIEMRGVYRCDKCGKVVVR